MTTSDLAKDLKTDPYTRRNWPDPDGIEWTHIECVEEYGTSAGGYPMIYESLYLWGIMPDGIGRCCYKLIAGEHWGPAVHRAECDAEAIYGVSSSGP